jgi:TetR/AcrR family tetracycline transcriptional repressor
MKITLNKIIEISIKILNDKGINNLSIREIASRLKVKSSSLYWHKNNKNDIYSKVSENIWNNITVPKNLKNSRKILFELNMLFRKELLKIKDSPEIIRKSKQKSSEYIEESINCIRDLGIKEKYCLTLVNMVYYYVLSYVENEQMKKGFKSEKEEQFKYCLEVLIKGIQTS